MQAPQFSSAHGAGSRRGRSRTALLVAAPFLLMSKIGAAQTPAPESSVAGRPIAAEADRDAGRTKDAGETKNAAQENAPAAKAPSQPAEAPKAVVASLDASSAPAREAAKDEPKGGLPPHGAGRAHYRTIIDKETARTGLPADIAEAVMGVESGFNPAVIGAAGEIGLMQIMPPTAHMLGFSGSLSELARPEVNIHYGVTYLAQAWRLAGGDLCTAVMKYRAGHGETRFSQLSVNYCLAVRSRLAARGYPVTGVVPIATFGEASRPFTRASTGGTPFAGHPFAGPPRVSLRAAGQPCRSHCLTALGGGRPNFNEINDTLNHLVLQSNVRVIRLR